MSISVTYECYVEIETWLEDIYNELPFKRIFENGKRLGYQGFIRNYRLEVEESGVSVEVRVVAIESGKEIWTRTFFNDACRTYSDEAVQGVLL